MRLNSALHLDQIANLFYRLAVAFDDLCFMFISNCRWRSNSVNLAKNQTCIVIANHVSWADIFLLQSAICSNGPVIKFVMKKQLLYVPIFAMIAYAFNFPFVKRRSVGEVDPKTRRLRDLARVKEACEVLHSSPAAVMVFPEGTRFTKAKQAEQDSEYEWLLEPRIGGFSTMVKSLVEFEPPVLNCTLLFPEGFTFWRFLGGAGGDVRVTVERMGEEERVELLDDPATWLRRAWLEKDGRVKNYQEPGLD